MTVATLKSIIHVKAKQTHPRKKHKVTFQYPFPVYNGKAYTTSLLLCNKHIDKFPRHIIGAIDSAATDHFMPDTYTDDAPRPTQNGIVVGCANGSNIQATATDVLAIPELPEGARGCHKFKDIHLSLISTLV